MANIQQQPLTVKATGSVGPKVELTPEQLAARIEQKKRDDESFRANLAATARAFIKTLPKDEDGVPYVKIRADDPGAWQAVMFYSQRLRDAGDQEGRVKFGHVAHGFELGLWKE